MTPPAPIVGPGDGDLHPTTYALKGWLSSAIHRCGLYPKALYLELGVDQSTFSRWMSLEHEHTLPMYFVPAVLELLDGQAADDLVQIRTPRRGSAEKQQADQRRSAL